jgi:hypothetical protein
VLAVNRLVSACLRLERKYERALAKKARIMFGFALTEMKQHVNDRWDLMYRFFAGGAFVVLAMASIQYDEHVAPNVERVSNAWSMTATDVGRRLSSFTL